MKKDFKKFLAVFAVITLLSVWMPGKFKYACAGSGEVCTATVTNIDYRTARLNWTVTGSTSTTNYQAIVYDDSGYSNQIYDTGNVSSSNTYHDIPADTLECNTTHYWKIRVYGNWGGTGMAWSTYALSGDTGDDAFTTTADATTPSTPVITDDGASTSNNASLHATWTSTDNESGIAEYQYAVSTSATDPGSGYITGGWISTGTTANVTTSCEDSALWTQTSDADFNLGTNDDTFVSGDSIRLSAYLSWSGSTHTEAECENLSGYIEVHDTGVTGTICRIASASAPSGWTQADHWQRYSSAMWGGDFCGNHLSSGPAEFSNTQSVRHYGGHTYMYCSQCSSCTSKWVYDLGGSDAAGNVYDEYNRSINRVEIGIY